MNCENIKCAYHQYSSNECYQNSYLNKHGDCNMFKKGLFYYIGLVADSLKNKNYVDMIELMLDPDIKIGLYYVMEIYGLQFSVMEHGLSRMILICDNNTSGLNFEQITKHKFNVDIMNKFMKDIDEGILPNQNNENEVSLDNKDGDIAGEFGWLSPAGDFRKSPFGHHEESAEFIIEDNHFGFEYDKWLDSMLDKNIACLHKDFLVEVKGYVLIHNPSTSGGYVVTYRKKLTKAQREFLYDYFIKIGDKWKAEQFLEESNASV